MGWPGRPEELCTIHSLQETGWLPTLRIEYINPAPWSPLSSGLLAQDNTKLLGGPVLQLWTLLWVPGVPLLVEAGVVIKAHAISRCSLRPQISSGAEVSPWRQELGVSQWETKPTYLMPIKCKHEPTQ